VTWFEKLAKVQKLYNYMLSVGRDRFVVKHIFEAGVMANGTDRTLAMEVGHRLNPA
jgi:hypothetical protein